MTPKQKIESLAREAGFELVGIVKPDNLDYLQDGLSAFLKKGHHGNMDWMEIHKHRRSHPKHLWAEVQSIIMLGMNYGPDSDPLAVHQYKDQAAISVYALGKDYHDLIKKRLKRVARVIHQEMGAEVKVFVDTAPVMENRWRRARPWVARQTYKPGISGSWLLGLHWVDFHDNRSHTRCTSAQSVRDVSSLP